MTGTRYAHHSYEELRELAAFELTDAAWAELEAEFEARGLRHPARPERWVSEREKGTDIWSRFTKGAAYYFVLRRRRRIRDRDRQGVHEAHLAMKRHERRLYERYKHHDEAALDHAGTDLPLARVLDLLVPGARSDAVGVGR